MNSSTPIVLLLLLSLSAPVCWGQIFLGELPSKPASKEVRFDNKGQGLWWKKSVSGRMDLYFSEKAMKDSEHPIVKAPEESVYAGQSLALNDSELIDVLGSDFKIKWPDLNHFIFNVVKAGTVAKPFYQLIGGHNKIFRTLMAAPDHSHTVNLRIVEDLTEFDHSEQIGLLELYGQFWSPTNPDGHYQQLSVRDLEQSPWRSIGKIKEARKRLSPLLNKSLAFPEVTFGQQIYLHLKSTGQDPDKIKTVHELLDVVRAISTCELNLTKN